MSSRTRFMYGVSARFLFAAVVEIAALHAASGSLAADVVVDTVLTDLSDPGSVAIRPSAGNAPTYEILIYDRGRDAIFSARNDQPGQSKPVIEGIAGREGAGILLALDSTHVIVGGGDDETLLSVYELSPQTETADANEPKQNVPAVEGMELSSTPGVSAVVRTRANDRVPDALILATVDEDGGSQMWRVPVRADTLGDAAEFSSAPPVVSKRVSALAVSPQGFIVATEKAADDAEAAAELAFYNPIDGSPVLRLPIELRNITALAFSPTSGNLYAAGKAPGNQESGVYRIDDKSRAGKPASVAVKIVDVERPRSLAFGPDGALYVTTVSSADTEDRDGTLQRITGDL